MEVPLLKALVDAGLGSRRRAAEAIKSGRVKVNGRVAESFLMAVNPESDCLSLDGKPVVVKTRPAIYLMLNKPPGVVSTTSDERGRPTVLDLLPLKLRCLGLHPVGRLDEDSTGLIVLTNDGNLTQRLTHPSFEVEKEYLIALGGRISPNDMKALARGVMLEDGMTAPVKVKEVKGGIFNYSVVIHEGRKRLLRRLFAHLGYRVATLKRVRTGSLLLGELGEGESRELTGQEVQRLRGV